MASNNHNPYYGDWQQQQHQQWQQRHQQWQQQYQQWQQQNQQWQQQNQQWQQQQQQQYAYQLYGYYYPHYVQQQQPPPWPLALQQYPHQQYQRQQPKPKQPVDNEVHHCCGRRYIGRQNLAKHQENHKKCSECDYAAVKAFVLEHEAKEHGKAVQNTRTKPDGVVPPNAPKIDTPEELAAWIEARKRNWPTQANIERKKREAEERKRRAQEEQEEKKKKRKTADDTTTSGLVADYKSDGSSAEEDDDEVMDPEKDAVTSKDPSSIGKITLPDERKKPKPGRRCKFFMQGRCKRGSNCPFVHDPATVRKQKAAPPPPTPIQKRPNLLRMLLANDIRREQNILLQCFRYIVDHDFFDNGVPEDEDDDKSGSGGPPAKTTTTMTDAEQNDNNIHANNAVADQDDDDNTNSSDSLSDDITSNETTDTDENDDDDMTSIPESIEVLKCT